MPNAISRRRGLAYSHAAVDVASSLATFGVVVALPAHVGSLALAVVVGVGVFGRGLGIMARLIRPRADAANTDRDAASALTGPERLSVRLRPWTCIDTRSDSRRPRTRTCMRIALTGEAVKYDLETVIAYLRVRARYSGDGTVTRSE